MKCKKLLSVWLAAVLVIAALPVSTLAAERDTQQEVLASVRERIGDTERFDHFDSGSDTAENGVKTYRFEWTRSTEDAFESLRVSCTQSGIITSYYASAKDRMDGRDKPTIHKMTSAQAMERAQLLADKLNPALKGTVKLAQRGQTESLYNDGYSFKMQRYENGLPFYGQTGSIRVDAAAEKIESYSINYDETLPIPAADGIIEQTAANAAFSEKLGMELVYKSYIKERERILYPVYIPASASYIYIDAKTGEPADMRSTISRDHIFGDVGGSKNEAADTAGGVEFSEAELAELERVEGLMDSGAVLDAIRKISVLDLPSELTLVRTSRIKDIYADAYYYCYTLENRAENQYASARITADAKTGALVIFSAYRDRAADVEAQKITKAALQEAAQTLTGERFSEYKQDEKLQSEDSIRYYRYVNGARFEEDAVSVTICPENGKVTDYACSYTEQAFPSVDGVISGAEAAQKLLSCVDYKPVYMARYTKEDGAQTRIVYMLDAEKPQDIDAFTGALLNAYSNTAYKDNSFGGYTDIAGHYAQQQIETLAKFGIRFAEEAYKPDAVITQKEFVSLLVAAFYNGGAVICENAEGIQSAYRQARNARIVTDAERNDDETVTRALAAKYMIRALGIEEYADLAGIYVCPFHDVTQYVGQISILSAMQVLSGDGSGSFYPDAALTRADAAVMIYNYLSR